MNTDNAKKRIAPLHARFVDAKLKMQKDAGLEFPPTDFTLPYRQAMSGEGELASQWEDKPHRLIYDLCREIERTSATGPLNANKR